MQKRLNPDDNDNIRGERRGENEMTKKKAVKKPIKKAVKRADAKSPQKSGGNKHSKDKQSNSTFVKIQDGTIIRRESLAGYHKEVYDKNGIHFYIAFYSRKKERYDMYPTSHYIDPKKTTDIKNGRAIKMKIREMKYPTTVYKIPRVKDINGQPFKDISGKVEIVGTLSSYQQKRLLKFLNKK